MSSRRSGRASDDRARRRQLVAKLGTGLMFLISLAITTWFTPLFGAIPTHWVIVLITVFALAIVAWLGRTLQASLLQVSALAVVVVAAGSLAALLAWPGKPSHTEMMVKSYFGLCKDPMWGNERVTCYPASRTYLLRHYVDFRPRHWNAFEPRAGATPIDLGDLSLGGPLLDGQVIKSVGEVIATQNLGGGELILQLRPPTVSAVRDADFNSGLFGEEDPKSTFLQMAGRGTPDGRRAEEVVYLNFAARPFFRAEVGSLVVFDGLPIAAGSVRQVSTSKIIPMTYVRGRSVEHVLARTSAGGGARASQN